MKTFSIFFNDLKPEAQAELLKTFGLSSADEMNWELVPIATVDIEDFDEEFNHIDDVVEALNKCTSIEEVDELLDRIPNKFGEWWYDVVPDGDGRPMYEVTNCYRDELCMEDRIDMYQLDIDVSEEE